MLKYAAFDHLELIAHGPLEEVALAARRHLKQRPQAQVLLFSDSSGKQMDLDLSGSEKELLQRLKVYAQPASAQSSGPGRPKLGVMSREVSLLPKHWEWLSNQGGGASATLRRLTDDAMKAPLSEKKKIQHAQEVIYRFLNALAGDLPNFEDAIRFLYRRDEKKFKELIREWPKDLVKHSMALAEDVFTN